MHLQTDIAQIDARLSVLVPLRRLHRVLRDCHVVGPKVSSYVMEYLELVPRYVLRAVISN